MINKLLSQTHIMHWKKKKLIEQKRNSKWSEDRRSIHRIRFWMFPCVYSCGKNLSAASLVPIIKAGVRGDAMILQDSAWCLVSPVKQVGNLITRGPSRSPFNVQAYTLIYVCARCPQRWAKANEGPAPLKGHSGCSTHWALIRELWKGEANPKATAAASNLHCLYGQTVRNDAVPSKTAARGAMLKDLLSLAFILFSGTFLVLLFTF